jgi:hypothetical protein
VRRSATASTSPLNPPAHPFLASVLNGDIAMCRFFTQLGVDVHATNNRGATPAEIGKSRHSAEVAAALGGPPSPAAPTLYSKGAKCLTIEWTPLPLVDSARVMFEVSG